jgi:hypothetical protein
MSSRRVAETITYPTLLDFPAPDLSGYPRETVVAEKLHAMVYLRTMNSRMKDFYDVWLLASQFAFDGALLAAAVVATFANRETDIDVAPIAFTPEFTEQASTVAQWSAFRGRLPNTESPAKLSEVVASRPARSAFGPTTSMSRGRMTREDVRLEGTGRRVSASLPLGPRSPRDRRLR